MTRPLRVEYPGVYYHIINQYLSAFERFDIKVRLDKRYDKIYKSTCSKMEREYINSYKFFNEFVDLYDEVKQDTKDYYKKRENKILKLESKIRNLGRYYKDAQKRIKAGAFTTLKDFWIVIKADARAMIKDIEKEKNTKIRRTLKIILVGICLIIISIIVLIVIFIIKYIKLKRKYNGNR